MRFCAEQNKRMEDLVREILGKVASAVDACGNETRFLKAIVLGGGYGRGEGGIFRTSTGVERLYNDLDLFVFTSSLPNRSVKEKLRSQLKSIELELSKQYTVEVEFGPLTSVHDLKNLSSTLMYQELARGWYPVWGDANVMSALPKLPLKQLPLSEGARLLMNRGAGLFLAKQRMEQERVSEEDSDFILRNMHKAALAVGDAFLLARGRYVFGTKKRLAALALEKSFPKRSLLEYRNAVKFKFSPSPEFPGDLVSYWNRVKLSWLGAYFDYFTFYRPGISDSPVILAKNIVKNLLYWPKTSIFDLPRHPRERLIHLLPGLLFDKAELNQYITTNVAPLASNGSYPLKDTLPGSVFLKLWRRFN